jgi:hypothetical protein
VNLRLGLGGKLEVANVMESLVLLFKNGYSLIQSEWDPFKTEIVTYVTSKVLYLKVMNMDFGAKTPLHRNLLLTFPQPLLVLFTFCFTNVEMLSLAISLLSFC